MESLVKQLLKLKVILSEIRSNSEQKKILNLLYVARELLSRLPKMPTSQRKATLIVPANFNKIMPTLPIDNNVLEHL